ncbi:MAG: CPBP family intramembrane glutamic endopeptidase [Anaerolineae bacterium]|nr:CPBP family intramembrane glutamic endopeptidase [Anaerolineae bacterium]
MKKQNSQKYIILVLSWTYVFWVSAAILSHMNPNWPGIFMLHLLGGIGPLVASLFIVTKSGGWKEYLTRIIKVRGFSPYLWIMILSPNLIAVITSLLIHGNIAISQQFVASGIGYAISLLFFGPIPEELGWRGVLFDDISQQSLSRAQVVTAGVWLLWHMPLFFIVGSYQHGVGFGTTNFFLWCIGLILQSIVMGYLYLLTNRSIASAILFHYFVNLVGELIEKNLQFEILSAAIYAVFVILTIALYRKMTKKPGFKE